MNGIYTYGHQYISQKESFWSNWDNVGSHTSEEIPRKTSGKFAMRNKTTGKYWTYGKQTDKAEEIYDKKTRDSFKAPEGYEWVEI